MGIQQLILANVTTGGFPISVTFESNRFRSGVACTSVFTFNTDGTTSFGGTGTNGGSDNPNWWLPTTAGIGNSYWIKFTLTSSVGTGSSGDSNFDTWYSLSTAISKSIVSESGSFYEEEVQVDFATSASDGSIVSTALLILIADST